jgi:hypothetical protein
MWSRQRPEKMRFHKQFEQKAASGAGRHEKRPRREKEDLRKATT